MTTAPRPIGTYYTPEDVRSRLERMTGCRAPQSGEFGYLHFALRVADVVARLNNAAYRSDYRRARVDGGADWLADDVLAESRRESADDALYSFERWESAERDHRGF